MTGGLMQLVAYGAQDIYLTGNPMITYFKVVYRRHTNFAMESIQQTFNGKADFGQKVTALISRNGDLVNGMVLEATLPGLPQGAGGVDNEHRWIDNVGHYLMSSVYVEIGGQKIDEHYSDWLEIWYQLTVPAGQRLGYLKMIGQSPKDTIGQPAGLQNPGSALSLSGTKIFVPLQFWFCRNVGLSLPLIALQYHEVKVGITFSAASALYTDHKVPDDTLPLTTGLTDVGLWVDYIYLDTDERRRFAQVSHEYLIEQLQVNDKSYSTTGAAASQVSVNLTINHPVKELIWVCKPSTIDGATVNTQPNNYTTVKADTGEVPLRSIVPKFTLEATSAIRDTEAVDLVHSHTFSGTTSNELAHTHGYSGTTGNSLGEHDHVYSRITQISLTCDYGNYEKEDGEHHYTTTVDINDSETGNTPQQGTTTESGVLTLASTTTAHNFTCPIVDDGETILQGVNPVVSGSLQLNGHERFSTRSGSYFNMVTTRQAHTNIPESPGINVYSFALKPEDHQPSGSCNFSRIDNARLNLTVCYPDSTGTNSGTLIVYATNYNVLRIMSGMGGLAYSN